MQEIKEEKKVYLIVLIKLLLINNMDKNINAPSKQNLRTNSPEGASAAMQG